jgi:hypothetical protein
MVGATQESAQQLPPPHLPSLASCWLTPRSETEADSHRDCVQADILDGGPDNCQATVLGREDVNLIGALPDEAPEAFDGIGGLNVSVHGLRKLVKRLCIGHLCISSRTMKSTHGLRNELHFSTKWLQPLFVAQPVGCPD